MILPPLATHSSAVVAIKPWPLHSLWPLQALASVLQLLVPLHALVAVLQLLVPLHALPAVLQSLVPLHELMPAQCTVEPLAAVVVPAVAQPAKINAAAPKANKVPLVFNEV
jgi:hypothetical protein